MQSKKRPVLSEIEAMGEKNCEPPIPASTVQQWELTGPSTAQQDVSDHV